MPCNVTWTATNVGGGAGDKPPCVHFHIKGNCKFGDRCYKSHSPITEAEKKKLKSQSRES